MFGQPFFCTKSQTIMDSGNSAEKKRKYEEEPNSPSRPQKQTRTHSILSDSLKCPICNDLAQDNRECSTCHQIFCSKCLVQDFEKNQKELKCPTCNVTWKNGINDLQKNVCIERLLTQLEVECTAKCGSKISRANLSLHLQHSCPESEVKCTNHTRGCTFICKRRFLSDHEKSCPHTLVTCACAASLLSKDLGQHRQAVCPMETVKCTCGETMMRSRLKQHESELCPNAQVPCMLCEIGCTWTGERSKMEAHLNENCKYGFAKQLYMLFKKKISDLESSVVQLKKEIECAPQEAMKKYIFCSTDKTVQIWDIEQGKIVKVVQPFEDHVTVILVPSKFKVQQQQQLIVSDSHYMVTGSYDRTVRVWSFDSNSFTRTMLCSSVVCGVAMNAGHVFAANFNGNIEVFNFETGQMVVRFKNHISPVAVFCVALVNQYLVYGCADGTVRIMDLLTRSIKVLKGHIGFVMKLVYHKGVLISCSANDRNVYMWDFSTGEVKHILKGHTDGVVALTMHEDEFIVTGSMDHTVRIWNLQGECVKVLKCQAVQSVCSFHNYIVCGTRDENGILKVFTRDSDQQVKILHAHSKMILFLARYTTRQTPSNEEVQHEDSVRKMFEEITANSKNLPVEEFLG